MSAPSGPAASPAWSEKDFADVSDADAQPVRAVAHQREPETPAAKKRPPPAFQFYASDLIAEEKFMLAELDQRGLFLTLLIHSWVNESIPAATKEIARLLGLDADAIERARGELILKHFRPVAGNKARLFSPELERQRERLATRHELLVKGGRAGGKATQRKRLQRVK